MTVKDGQVFYQSRITESSRYKGQGSSDKNLIIQNNLFYFDMRTLSPDRVR